MPNSYGARAAGNRSGWTRRGVFVAIAALLGGAGSRPIRLLTLGDSLTAGYGLPHEQGFEARLAVALAGAGRQVTILDGGVSGDTSAGGLARLDWVMADKLDAAIVELGANDGLRALSPEEMEKNLTAILDRLAGIPVLLSGMEAPPNLGRDYTEAFRAVFTRLSSRPGILFDAFFLEGVAAHPELIQADGLHPNAIGVQRIVDRLLPMVLRLLDKVSVP